MHAPEPKWGVYRGHGFEMLFCLAPEAAEDFGKGSGCLPGIIDLHQGFGNQPSAAAVDAIDDRTFHGVLFGSRFLHQAQPIDVEIGHEAGNDVFGVTHSNQEIDLHRLKGGPEFVHRFQQKSQAMGPGACETDAIIEVAPGVEYPQAGHLFGVGLNGIEEWLIIDSQLMPEPQKGVGI